MRGACKIYSSKKAQIWVETVIYTLIGIAVIGLVLAVSLPKIEQKKDEIIIEQSVESLGTIDNKIFEVQKAVGNRRSLDLKISKGKLIIDMDNDTLIWELDSSFEYSEKDTVVPLGRVNITTREENPWKVTLTIGYPIDLKFNGELTGRKEIDAAPTPYQLIVENEGVGVLGNGKLEIDIKEV